MTPKKTKTRVGLDIGSYAIKVVQVAVDQKQLSIQKIGVQELPPGPAEQTLPQALKTLIERVPIDLKEVNISVAGANVVVRFIELPLMQEAELAQALPYEAEKHIPFDIKETILDHVILNKNQSERKVNALLVGVRNAFVENRLKLLNDVGVSPTVIDVDAFAVFNAFQKCVAAGDVQAKTVGLVNIGASLTSVVVVHENQPWMVRDVSVGGVDITQALQAHLKIDTKQAQQFKHNPKNEAKMMPVIRGVLQKISDEVKLSLGYYENKYGKGVDELYISGGSNKLKGLVPFLKESTALEAKPWDPLAAFSISSGVSQDLVDEHREALAVCSGLVLRR